MAKDYVKKRSVKQRNNASKQFLVILASFLGGYLTASVFDFTSLSTWVNQQIAAHQKPQPEVKKVVKKHEAPKPKFEFYTLLAKDSGAPIVNRPAPSTIVKQSSTANTTTTSLMPQAAGKMANAAPVVAQPSPTHTQPVTPPVAVRESKPVAPVRPANAVASPVPANTRPVSRETYLLQIASFNKRGDAEHLKASLLLHGFDVVISPTTHGNVIWYRVIVGPFYARGDVEKAQVAISHTEHMRGIIRKLEA